MKSTIKTKPQQINEFFFEDHRISKSVNTSIIPRVLTDDYNPYYHRQPSTIHNEGTTCDFPV